MYYAYILICIIICVVNAEQFKVGFSLNHNISSSAYKTKRTLLLQNTISLFRKVNTNYKISSNTLFILKIISQWSKTLAS